MPFGYMLKVCTLYSCKGKHVSKKCSYRMQYTLYIWYFSRSIVISCENAIIYASKYRY